VRSSVAAGEQIGGVYFEPLVRVEVRADPSVSVLHRDLDGPVLDGGVVDLVVAVVVGFEQIAQGLHVPVAEESWLPRREPPHKLVACDVGQEGDLHWFVDPLAGSSFGYFADMSMKARSTPPATKTIPF
jgi:hypothetical protein